MQTASSSLPDGRGGDAFARSAAAYRVPGALDLPEQREDVQLSSCVEATVCLCLWTSALTFRIHLVFGGPKLMTCMRLRRASTRHLGSFKVTLNSAIPPVFLFGWFALCLARMGDSFKGFHSAFTTPIASALGPRSSWELCQPHVSI